MSAFQRWNKLVSRLTFKLIEVWNQLCLGWCHLEGYTSIISSIYATYRASPKITGSTFIFTTSWDSSSTTIGSPLSSSNSTTTTTYNMFYIVPLACLKIIVILFAIVASKCANPLPYNTRLIITIFFFLLFFLGMPTFFFKLVGKIITFLF